MFRTIRHGRGSCFDKRKPGPGWVFLAARFPGRPDRSTVLRKTMEKRSPTGDFYKARGPGWLPVTAYGDAGEASQDRTRHCPGARAKLVREH
jgi:hypothetical protein